VSEPVGKQNLIYKLIIPHIDIMHYALLLLEGSSLCRQYTAWQVSRFWDRASGMFLHSGPRPAVCTFS